MLFESVWPLLILILDCICANGKVKALPSSFRPFWDKVDPEYVMNLLQELTGPIQHQIAENKANIILLQNATKGLKSDMETMQMLSAAASIEMGKLGAKVESMRELMRNYLEDQERCVDGQCYWFWDLAKTWTQAELECMNKGSDLASIHTQAQQDLVEKLCVRRNCWIGLTDQAKEGDFHWEDGSKVNYTNWAPGEPNNSNRNGGEHCVVISPRKNKQWNDFLCKAKVPFICSTHGTSI